MAGVDLPVLGVNFHHEFHGQMDRPRISECQGRGWAVVAGLMAVRDSPLVGLILEIKVTF